MMDDLISRQAAIELVDWYQHEFIECDYAFGELSNELSKLPSAQPERKKGKWVFEDGSPVNRGLKVGETAVCSQCGETAPGYPFWECDLELTNFCPHCGARMDERGNDE